MNLFQIEVSGASVHLSGIHKVDVCSARVCVREQLYWQFVRVEITLVFPFIASLLFFLLESLYLQRKGGHPLDPLFFFPPPFFSLLFFSLLLFCLISLLFAVA